MTWLSRLTELPLQTRRFWAVAAASFALGPIAWTQFEVLPDGILVAAASLGALIMLSWFAESCQLSGRSVVFVSLASAIVFSLSLMPWSITLVVWLLGLTFASAAIHERPSAQNCDRVAETPPEVENAIEAEDDEQVVASFTRRREVDVEMIEGLVTATGESAVHVVFHPPLANAPTVELHPLDDCTPRLSESTPHGLRISTKGPGRVAFTAEAPAA